MQCLSNFPILLCAFASTTYLIFYGTNNALFIFVAVMKEFVESVVSIGFLTPCL